MWLLSWEPCGTMRLWQDMVKVTVNISNGHSSHEEPTELLGDIWPTAGVRSLLSWMLPMTTGCLLLSGCPFIKLKPSGEDCNLLMPWTQGRGPSGCFPQGPSERSAFSSLISMSLLSLLPRADRQVANPSYKRSARGPFRISEDDSTVSTPEGLLLSFSVLNSPLFLLSLKQRSQGRRR